MASIGRQTAGTKALGGDDPNNILVGVASQLGRPVKDIMQMAVSNPKGLAGLLAKANLVPPGAGKSPAKDESKVPPYLQPAAVASPPPSVGEALAQFAANATKDVTPVKPASVAPTPAPAPATPPGAVPPPASPGNQGPELVPGPSAYPAANAAAATANQDAVKSPNAALVGAMLSGVRAPGAPNVLAPVSPPQAHQLPIDKGEALLQMLGLAQHAGVKAL